MCEDGYTPGLICRSRIDWFKIKMFGPMQASHMLGIRL